MIGNTCNDCGTENRSHDEFCNKCSGNLNRDNNKKRGILSNLFSLI